jgi:predicted enzyme related to lactoylglutathione lyase
MIPPSYRPVVHLELHTGDLDAARAYYAQRFGWRAKRVDTRHGSYQMVDLAPGLDGGIVECGVAARALWLPYVEVPEIAAATRRAAALGGEVTFGPREGPEGWRSVVTTPAGGEIALWQQKR